MIRTLACLSVLLVGSTALAQGLGLDLTQDEHKTQPAKKPAQNPPPSNTTGNTSQPVNPPDQSPTLATAPEPSHTGEAAIIEEDRVKSVQRKVFLKTHRFELEPEISASVNDSYYTKFGGALRANYYFADTLGVGVRFGLYQTLPTDDVRLAKRTFQSRIFYSVPKWSAMADVQWSPIYGKATVFNSIIEFDAYLLGGVGAVRTETSDIPGHGLNPAADLGIGIRFMVRDYLAVGGALVNTTYVDQPAGTTQGATQNVMTLNAGISVFFPFHSTGREGQ